MIAILAALVIGQSTQTPSPKAETGPVLGPMIPAGCNSAFQEAALHMQERLEKGDFEGAGKIYKALPKLNFSIGWDDSKVPAQLKPSFAEARDRALTLWARSYPKSVIKVYPFKKGAASPHQIVVNFVDSLPAKAEDPVPPAAIHFFSEDPSEPRLEVVLSLKRGNPGVATDFVDIHNEVAYALIQYLGVERSVQFGSFSSRTELPTSTFVMPSISERVQVNENIAACDQLAKAVLKKQLLIPARPNIHLDPVMIDAGKATQGDLVEFKFQVTNTGNAPLQVKAVPDCACIGTRRVSILQPGQTALIPAQIDLTDVVGEFDKSILVFSNDLEKTVYRMPVKVYSKPVFRLFSENDGNVLMSKGGVHQKVYLVVPDGVSLTATSAFFKGIDTNVTMKPWQGTLADPEMNEGPLPRKGYVFDLKISDQIAPGRNMGTLHILTDHPKYKEILANQWIQAGIVASPERVLLGEIPAAPRRSGFLLAQPKRAFKIASMSVDSPFLTLTKQPGRGDWEHRILIQFDGKAASGPLEAMITIRTDNPSQPVIKVPFSAMVR